jgi:hypothetical protein
MIWLLTLWSLTVAPFEGGQYLSQERCERAAPNMVEGLYPTHGRLRWRCDLMKDAG